MGKRLLLGFVVVIAILGLSLNAQAKNLRVPDDYATIQEAVDAAGDGDVIKVDAGQFAGAIINKPVTIKGSGNDTIIDPGVAYHPVAVWYKTAFRLDAGADGTEISHMMIPNKLSDLYLFGVFSRYVDDVSIHHLTITSTIQGITNWNGSGWTIMHNKLFGVSDYGGGGIGILIGTNDPDTPANGSLVSHNKVEGIVDANLYSGPGVLLTSGHGTANIYGGDVTGNKVVRNRCLMTGLNGVGIETNDTDLRFGLPPRVRDNKIGFNDNRGSTYEMYFELDADMYNTVSKNLGKNRGHGLTPASVFNDQMP
jgi:hypothetical protein